MGRAYPKPTATLDQPVKESESLCRGTSGRRLEAIVRDRNSAQKHAARAKVILATADGCGTMEIARRSGLSKPAVWCWQERFMHAGVDGLLRDKTRPPGKLRLPDETVRRVLDLTPVGALGIEPGGVRLPSFIAAKHNEAGFGRLSGSRDGKSLAHEKTSPEMTKAPRGGLARWG